MQPEIQRRFDLIEQQRAELIAFVTSLDDTQRGWTPSTYTWTIQQTVEHLVLSDETVGQAQDASSIPLEPLPARLVPRAWRLALVLGALQRDRALPLPSPDIAPLGTAAFPELLSRWEAARIAMCNGFAPLRGEETPYFHPILGRLTAVQMLTLSATHTAYHTRQMARLQADPAFPRAFVGSTS